MSIDVLEHRLERAYELLGDADEPGGFLPVVVRPALLAGEEHDVPDPCIFRGLD
ncbi:hypothetical protein [Streptomyces sp. NPDC058812]|uniref:hypothetical protein n=1 Tax=unclassified Streptomyces TaxID=2593676 RepID=UPI003677074B